MVLPQPTARRPAHCSTPHQPPRPPQAPKAKAKPRRQLNPAQRQFAVTHLNLARQQARLFAIRHGMAYEDVLGAAYEGLCKAALGFEAERGHRPSSYIVPKVKGELLHYLRDTGFLLRISHRMRELWFKARPSMHQGVGDAAIAEQLGIALHDWLEVRRACALRPLPLPPEGLLADGVDGNDFAQASDCR
jgi:DNA-directed RNA polymerase specialized sigma subunit